MTALVLRTDSATRWRLLATTRPLAMALVAGVLATHIATVFGFWFHGIFGLPNLDFPRFNAYLLFKPDIADMAAIFEATTSTSRLVIGWIVHLFTGVVWALVYAILVHPLLRWRNTTLGNLGKAVVWGVVLALISGLWWVPVLFPDFSPGMFGETLFGLGEGIVAIVLWHLIWAVNLALFYNPLPDDEAAALSSV